MTGLGKLWCAAREYYRAFGFYKTVGRSFVVGSAILIDSILILAHKAIRVTNLALYRYFEDRNIVNTLKKYPGVLKIGIVRVGGIGDAVLLTAFASAVRKRWPEAEIFVFVRSKSQAELLRHNHDVTHVFSFRDNLYLTEEVFPILCSRLVKAHLDICFLDRYVVKVFFRDDSFGEYKKQVERAFQKYSFNFYNFPHHTCDLYAKFGMSDFALRSACTGLSITPDQLNIPLDERSLDCLQQLPPCYLTVHHGADSEMNPRHKTESGLQTKNWFGDRWAQVVAFCSSRGIPVVQLGVSTDPLIPGVLDFRGKTSLMEAGAILKHSFLHMDTEGGLVHLAKAMRTRSLVVFGPTAVGFYGYDDNINIASDRCTACWWSTLDWYRKCPKGHDLPACMNEITASMVIELLIGVLASINQREADRSILQLLDFSLFSEKALLAERDCLKDIYASAGLTFRQMNVSALNSETGAYIHGSKNWEYPYVVRMIENHMTHTEQARVLDVGAGRGALQIYLASEGKRKVFSCDYDYNEHSPHGKPMGGSFLRTYSGSISFRTGSVFNLPYDDEQFECVVCVSVVEHFRNKDRALAELIRVLKPGGLLVLTFDVTTDDRKCSLEDTARVEIWSEKGLQQMFPDCHIFASDTLKHDIEIAMREIQEASIEGIPAGLTVGGCCFRKKAV